MCPFAGCVFGQVGKKRVGLGKRCVVAGYGSEQHRRAAMSEAPPQSPRSQASAAIVTPSPPAPAGGGDVVGTAAAARLLEARLRRLEGYLGFRPLTAAEAEMLLQAPVAPAGGLARPPAAASEGLEMEIGEYWLARIGVVALIVGLGFLVAYPFPALPAAVPSAIGFGAGGLCYWLGRRWRQPLPEMSRLLFWGSLFLVYFATLRLHFFSRTPLVESRALAVGLLAACIAGQYVVAARRASEFTAAIVTLLAFVTAFASNSVPAALALVVGVAAVAVWFVRVHGWHAHYLLALAGSFLCHLLMLLNNPLAGHPVRAIAEPQYNLGLLAAYATVFASAGFLPGVQEQPPWLRALRPMVIGGGALFFALFNSWLFHRNQAPWVELGAAVGLFGLAVAGWRHHQSRFGTSFYACAAFVALSVCLVRAFPAPQCYNWLAWQALLVAVAAVWFRSKILVVANLVIFAGIYLVYLSASADSGPVNLSFAAVALLTARVLNWQKERLDLRTELMRNLYLGAAAVAIPYGLYHTVPPAWVSSSWLAAAGLYFGVSILLRNRKYRWMAIGTVFATVGYVFVVDLARLAPAYRIVSFLVLGVALLVISVFYTRHRQKEAAPPPAGDGR